MYLWVAAMVVAGVQQLMAQAGAQAGVRDGEAIGHMAVLITDLMEATMLLQSFMPHQ
jgi:hypothetical protein